jgi:hypothetical protein
MFETPHAPRAPQSAIEAMVDDLGIVKPPGQKYKTFADHFGGQTTARLANLLTNYDGEVVKDATQLRTYVTHRLVEVSNCGDIKHELKALELLGKIPEVGLFSERTEITVTHKTSDELAEAIRGKIQRLLNSDVIDVTPIEEPEDEVETELEPELEIAVDEVLSFGSAQSADVEPE